MPAPPTTRLSALLRRSKNKHKGAQVPSAGSGGSGVVVACDNADVRELIARVVGRAGHDVEQVEGSEATLAALSASPRLAVVTLLHDAGATDLVEGVRGADDPAVAAIPLLAVTDDEATASAASVAGADGTIIRPFHADELTDELDAVLARSPEDRAELRAGAALKRLD
jgi:DNA-binding response OmpR family regulator